MTTLKIKQSDGTWKKAITLGSFDAAKRAETAATTAQNAADIASVAKNAIEYLVDSNYPYVIPQMFGAIGDGVADDTVAIKKSIATNKKVIFPKGTYIVSDGLCLNDGQIIEGFGYESIIKRKSNSSMLRIIKCGEKSSIQNLTIDGNGANQTTEAYSILSYHKNNVVLNNINIKDSYGIGVGLHTSPYAMLYNVNVDGCLASKPGFWLFAENEGNISHITMENCSATNNQLDGIIISTNDVKIIGGNFSHNGYGGFYSGALGAAGIYGSEEWAQSNIIIDNVTCGDNSEYGINANLQSSSITNSVLTHNQLGGIVTREGYGTRIANNLCRGNGWYTGSLNPTTWVKSGIEFGGNNNNLTIVGNTCIDPQNFGQEYGIRFNPNYNDSISERVLIIGNNCKYNTIGSDNINPSIYQNAKLTNLSYLDIDNVANKNKLSMPSNTKYTISEDDIVNGYTALADGWFRYVITATDSGNDNVSVFINSELTVYQVSKWSITGICPVSKGQTIRVTRGESTSNPVYTFIYSQSYT